MQQAVTCPNCGSQNAANLQFCVSCGAHLVGTARQVSHVPIVTGVVAPPPPITGVVLESQTAIGHPVASRRAPAAQTEIRPTWGLAWGLLWRMVLIWLLVGLIVFLGYVLVRMSLGYTSVFGMF